MLVVKGKFTNTITINGNTYSFEVSTLYNKNKVIVGYVSFREQGIPILQEDGVTVSDNQFLITIHGFSRLYKEFNITSINNNLSKTLANEEGLLFILNPLESQSIVGDIPMAYTIGGGSIVMSPALSYIDTGEMIGFLKGSESYYVLSHKLPIGSMEEIIKNRKDLLRYFINNISACFVLSSSHLRVFLKIGIADIVISHNHYIITLIPNSYLSCLYIPKVINIKNNILGIKGCVVKHMKDKEEVLNYLREVITAFGNQTEFLNI